MNDYVYPIIILPLLLLLLLAIRVMTTFFHEFGHAIPALLFTKSDVKIFLGSHGNVKKSKLFKFGRLKIYFRSSLLRWSGGMIRYDSESVSTVGNLIVLISGALFALMIVLVLIWVAFFFDLNGYLKLISIMFLFPAVLGLTNLYPNNEPILSSDGTYIHNDGFQIRRILSFKTDSKTLNTAYELYSNAEYREAIKLLNKLNPNAINNGIFNLILTAHCYDKNYAGGKESYQKILILPNMRSPDSDNYANIGVIESMLGDNELAMEFYNKSIELNNDNVHSLSNRGYTYNLFEKYNEAIIDFDKAIENDPNFAYAWANRGYSKIKLNLVDDGLSDIKSAIAIDNSNSYAYRNLGLYYLEKNDYAESLENLQKAFDLDPDTHMIKDYLRIVEARVSQSKLDLT